MSTALVVHQQSLFTPEKLIHESRFSAFFNDENDNKASEWASSREFKDRVHQWHAWFIENHPTEENPTRLADLDQWNGDFRIFFLANPHEGARLLFFVDACYGIDRALCGTSKASLEEVEKWKALDPIKYLMCKDHITWWEIDLCQLLDDIEQIIPTRFADIIKAERIQYAFQLIFVALEDDLYSAIFTSMAEGAWSTSHELMGRIYSREILLQEALSALQSSLARARQRSRAGNEGHGIDSAAGASSGHQGMEVINEGIRRRMPNLVVADSESVVDDSPQAESVSSSLAQTARFFYASSEVDHAIENQTRQSTLPPGIEDLGHQIIKFLTSKDGRRTRNKTLDFLIHKSTVLSLTLCLVGASVALIAVSIIHAQSEVTQSNEILDSNFYSAFSQAVLTLQTIYLTILPPLRNRCLDLRYRSWFWICLLCSAITSVVSLAVYPSQPIASLVFAYGASFSQVVSTLLLVECIEKAAKDGTIDGPEMT